jgi:hypothetical protein
MNQTNQIDQSDHPIFRITPSGAGGGFQHMLVDSHHICLRRVTTRHLFAGKPEPLPYDHAGTHIALHVGHDHVSRP